MYPGNKRNTPTPTYKLIPNIKVENTKKDFSISKEITLCNNIDLNETYSYYKYMNEDLSNTDIVNDNKITNKYQYNAVQHLNINIDDTNTYHTVFVCAYKVADDGLHPFIQYLLYKESNTEILDFPNFIYISPEHSVNYSTILLN